MANNLIQIKRTSVSGRAANTTTLANAGELALNMTDGIMYSTNGTVVFEIGANNTNASVSGNLTVNGVIANGSIGSSGQVLKSNGSSTYWGTDYGDVGSAGQILYRNSSNVLTTSSGLQYDGTSLKVNGNLESVYNNGSEGGEIFLSKPATGTSIAGTGVTLDIFENKLRIFENGGNNRGAYIDITAAANGVASNLLTGGGGGSGTVTSVGSGNGLTGGPITGSGTLSVLANNGITANATGVFVDQAYNYTWSGTQTFSANISFTGNNISLVTNTGSVMFAGSSDTNWRIGRNTGATTKFYYTNNSLDIIAANSNLEGIVFGFTGDTYLETGYAGTFTKNPIRVGNSTVNTTINSTSFTGTANNASYLGGTIAASYIQNTDSRTLSGNLNFTAANVYFSGGLFGSVKPRVSSTTSITSPLAWNSDNFDQYIATAQAGSLTISADAGAPVNGQKVVFRFKDNGSAQTLSFTTGSSKSFRAVGITLPTTTTAGKTLYVGAIYNSDDSRWDVIATALEA